MKKQNSLKVLSLILILLFFASCRNTTITPNDANIAFIGDIMMHVAVKKCAAYNNDTNWHNKSRNNHGFDFLFAKIKDYLEAPDIMCGNMEFPVAPPFKQQGLIFNCPPQIVPALKNAGLDVLTLSNNHVMDQGYDGVKSTFSYLDAEKLDYIGVNKNEEKTRSGIIMKAQGIRIGLMAYTGVMNYGYPHKNNIFHLNKLYEVKEILRDIKAIRSKCDFLVMQIHTGIEYTIRPRYSDTLLFRKILEAGVDLIIGHHPHTLQNMEQYKTKDGRTATIFYSLGNFICDQSRTIPLHNKKQFLHIRDSIIVYVSLEKHSNRITPVYRIVPTHTLHTWVKTDSETYKNIQTVAIADEINALKEKYSNTPREQQKKIEQQLVFLHSRIQAIENVLLRGRTLQNVHILKPE